MTDKTKILRSAWVITLFTLTSRVFGYIRDQRITLLLGTSLSADSFVLAYRIPNLLRRLVGEGSMTAAFIPVFTSYLAREEREAVWKFANRVFWTLALVVGAVTVLGMAYSSQIVHFFTLFGGPSGEWSLAVYLNRIIFPFLFFISLSALAMAILNSFHVFGLPAASPILANLVIIAMSFGVIYRPLMQFAPEQYRTPAVVLAAAVVIGGALQFLIQVPELVRRGMDFHFNISFSDPGIRKVARLTVPGFFGIGVYQVNFFIGTIFATSSRMPRGSITSLYVAERITELVLGAFAISVATAILPMMSMQAASGDFETLKKTMVFSMRTVFFVAVPAALALVLLRQPIVQVLFQHGQFSNDSTALTSRALLYYAIGLPAFAGVKLIVPAFYSLHDMMSPVRVAAYAMLLNLALNLIFIEMFFQTLYNGSPALATSLSAYFNFGLLFIILSQRLGRLGTRGLANSFVKIVACAVAMEFVCYAILRVSNFSSYQHFLPRLAVLAVLVAAGLLSYLGMARLLRC
ncbi:MAG: murein biosynthesis integral membrane protein MurJ [Candidatus Acidiferrales bacterium]